MAKILKCTAGNKPCKGRCIPIEWNCKEEQQKLHVNLDVDDKLLNRNSNIVLDIINAKKIRAELLPRVDKRDAQNIKTGEFTVGKIPPGSIIRNYFTLKEGEKNITGRHYGIYLGNGKIAHIKTGITLPNGRKLIRPQHLVIETFKQAYNPTQSKWELEPNQKPVRTLEQIKKIVEDHEGAPIKYDFLHGNCENIARAIVEKKSDSRQARAVGSLSPILWALAKWGQQIKIGNNEAGMTAKEFENLEYGENKQKRSWTGLDEERLESFAKDVAVAYEEAKAVAENKDELLIIFTEQFRTILEMYYCENVGVEIPEE